MEVYHVIVELPEDVLAVVAVKLAEGVLSFKCVLKMKETSFSIPNVALNAGGSAFVLPNVELSEEEYDVVLDHLKEYTSLFV
jgi:hypothetical protein